MEPSFSARFAFLSCLAALGLSECLIDESKERKALGAPTVTELQAFLASGSGNGNGNIGNFNGNGNSGNGNGNGNVGSINGNGNHTDNNGNGNIGDGHGNFDAQTRAKAAQSELCRLMGICIKPRGLR